MKFIVITLFPEMFSGILSESILKRGLEKKLFEVDFINLRDFGVGPRRQVDDTPYGGGVGMVLKVDVMAAAIEVAKSKLKNSKVILLTPQGKIFEQKIASEMAANQQDIILICGHYEGFDERISSLVDEEISLGKFVLTGGEIPAMAILDSVSRLIPGVLGKEESFQNESFSKEDEIECPHYTRPEIFNNQKVPSVLLSGNHAAIENWRLEQAKIKSKKYRSK